MGSRTFGPSGRTQQSRRTSGTGQLFDDVTTKAGLLLSLDTHNCVISEERQHRGEWNDSRAIFATNLDTGDRTMIGRIMRGDRADWCDMWLAFCEKHGIDPCDQ